jgi:DNA-binding MarR family transcriptional regulator
MTECFHTWISDIQESLFGIQTPVEYCEECGQVRSVKRKGRSPKQLVVYRAVKASPVPICARDIALRTKLTPSSCSNILRLMVARNEVYKIEPLRHLGERHATLYGVE